MTMTDNVRLCLTKTQLFLATSSFKYLSTSYTRQSGLYVLSLYAQDQNVIKVTLIDMF